MTSGKREANGALPPDGDGKVPPSEASKDSPDGRAEEPELQPSAAHASAEPPARRLRRTASDARTRRSPDRALQDSWVERLREGDTEALREVVHAFADRLTAVVCGVLRDRDAVEDVVQETFTKAFYRIGSFKGGSSLYTWLYRIAVNGAKDHIKSRRRRPASSLEDLPDRTAMPAPDRPRMEGLERRELRLQVRGAIAKLPRRFRVVLALRELEGMTYNEIAEVTGLSLGTVESRLFRARRRLRDLLTRTSSSVDRKGQDA